MKRTALLSIPLLVAVVVVSATGAAPTAAAPTGARAAATDAAAREFPSLASRWWEEPGACPKGTTLRRDAPATAAPDACPAPYCAVWCERRGGARHGRETGWYGRAGQKHHEGAWRDGEKDGRWVVWYLGGQPADDGAWVRGQQDGLWQQWWEGGELYRTVEFRRGEVRAVTPYRDGRPLPTEHAAVEGKGLAEPQPLTTPPKEPPPAEPVPPQPAAPKPFGKPPQDYLAAVLAEFPEAYRELAEVTYEETGDGVFAISAVRVLAPEAAFAKVTAEEQKARACRVKERLGLDCACEKVEVGPAQDYAWHSWKDKRVVPVVVKFFIGC